MVKKFIYSLMLLGIVFMNNACRDDENIESPFDFNKPCLQWGADMQTVKEYMDGFVLEKETSSELHYVGQDTEKTISYHFIDGNLNTSVIILDEDMVKSNLATTIYKGYINEEDDQQIFIEIKNSTMGYTKRLTINEKSYVVVSWSEVTFSDIEHI